MTAGVVIESHYRLIRGLWAVVDMNDSLTDIVMLYMSAEYQKEVDEEFESIVDNYDDDI